MLQRTGEAETITTHYLFALGAYRALYIPNWIYRYFFDVPRFWDPIAVIAGIVQTILYSDFFWIYYTKYVSTTNGTGKFANAATELSRGRSSICQCKRSCRYRAFLGNSSDRNEAGEIPWWDPRGNRTHSHTQLLLCCRIRLQSQIRRAPHVLRVPLCDYGCCRRSGAWHA